MYEPDNFVIIRFGGPRPHYRVLAGWSGGYTSGSSWRMNSGIVRVDHSETHWYFFGETGSCYSCHRDSYGLRMNNAHVWAQLQAQWGDKVVMMDDQDWSSIDWAQ